MSSNADHAEDVASYDKEIENRIQSNGMRPVNLVDLILTHGVSGRQFKTPLEVKLFLRKEIEHYEELFYEALSIALSDKELQKSDHTMQWLAALPYIVSGNTWYSQIVS